MSVVPSTSEAIAGSSASNQVPQAEDATRNPTVAAGSDDLIRPKQLLPPPPVGPLPIDPGTIDPTDSSAAALARSAASSLAFIFKRPPLRFFRPVKISTYGALQVMAEERGKPVSIKFVRSVIKTEGSTRFILNHVLPPFCFNTVIGLTLFTTYTTAENQLSSSDLTLHPYLVPALAGGIAGAAQSLISAPLDNLRLLQAIRSDSDHLRNFKFKGWIPLLKKVFLPLSHPIHSSPRSTNSEKSKLWASRGSSMLGLSILKDSIGFATFFSLFQIGRDLGKRSAGSVDQSIYIMWTRSDAQGFDESQRGWTGRILQSFVIVLSGATAGWAYGIVAEPFERIRRVLWQARFDWASMNLYDQSDRHQTQSSHRPSSKSSPSCHAHQDRHRLYDFTPKARSIDSKTSKTKAPASNKVDLTGPPNLSSNLEQERHRLKEIKTKHSTIFRSERPPSVFQALEIIRLARSGEDRSNRFVSILRRGFKNKLIDSTSTTGMKLDELVKPVRLIHHTHSKGSLSLRPKIVPNHTSRVTGFKSFILSPYSVGFFVWAVCSGDLSA